jgi:hypothetical protein
MLVLVFSFRACRCLLLLGLHDCFLLTVLGCTCCFQRATVAYSCVRANVLSRFCMTQATAVNMCMEKICTRFTNYLVSVLQTKKNKICEQRLGTSRLALWHSACERTTSFHCLSIDTVNHTTVSYMFSCSPGNGLSTTIYVCLLKLAIMFANHRRATVWCSQ